MPLPDFSLLFNPQHYPVKEEYRGQNYNQIISRIYVGDHIASIQAPHNGFTHVLNVAEELNMTYPDQNLVYQKIPMKDHHQNEIPKEKILEAVHWLMRNDCGRNVILVNCHCGIGRSGSVAVAYTFAKNPSWSYSDAVGYVSQRRKVEPHVGLKETLYTLFPRMK